MLAANPLVLDISLPSGRLHAQRFGPATAPLALCVPGPGVPRPYRAYAVGAGASSHADNAISSLDDLELEPLGRGEPYPGRLPLPAR